MKNRNYWLAIISIIAIISPLSFSDLRVSSQVASSNEITADQVWSTDWTIDQTTTINPGVTVVVEKGVKIKFSQPRTQLRVAGNLFIKGALNNPVHVTTDLVVNEDSFSINSLLGGNVVIQNAEIEKGGSSFFLMGSSGRRALAADISHTGAVYGSGGKIDVQGTTFKNNYKAVTLADGFSNVHVNRSKFIDNDMDIFSFTSADFQYNWWGSASGPMQTCNVYRCVYPKIYKSVNFSNWLTSENFHDPVIIIPGILGSWEEDGKMQIDPIFHTYDNLYAEFVANGYVPEKDLFTFPYEWRDSNVVNAQRLKIKIAEIKLAQKWPKVDLVAHSMGGILAREYVESASYGRDIDQLITLATPNLGSPEVYTKWEGDGWFFSALDIFIKHVIGQEAEEDGFADRFDYMHNRPMSSLKELLPVYDYLFDIDNNNQPRIYSNNYPRNEFLENLNSNAKVSKLNFVEYDKIIGNIDGENTISGLNVIIANIGKYWIHGYPLGFEIPIGDRGMKLANGDRTVPYFSAKSENIRSDYFLELSSDHQSIVTDAQKDVLEILTGTRPETEVKKSLIRNILFTAVYSPVDIQIIAPDGKWVGKNISGLDDSRKIIDAYYTGSNTQNEFITIPNPENGEYKILIQGIGDGEYRVESTKISEDVNNPQNAIESTGTISGDAEMGKVEEKIVTVAENEVIAEVLDVIPPVITGSATTSPNENGWYASDVTVHFEASDDESGIESVTGDVTLSGEGAGQSVVGIAKDKAGNSASFTVDGINIDKTAPAVKIASPENNNYLNNQWLQFDYSVADEISGLQDFETRILYDGNTFENNGIDLSLQDMGSHKFTVFAMDRAGNKIVKEVPFVINTDIQAIQDNVNHYFDLGLIPNSGKKVEILAHLKSLETDDQIEKLIQQIENMKDWQIFPQARELLIKNLEYLK